MSAMNRGKFDRGKVVCDSTMQYFDKEPCIGNAMQVFFACRKYGISIPDAVLDVIGEHLKSDQEKLHKKNIKRMKDYSEKQSLNDQLLWCALEADTLEKAYDSYREKEREAVEDGALRQRLERYLDGKITSLCKNEFDCEPSQLPVFLPTKLSSKLSFYKDLLNSIF